MGNRQSQEEKEQKVGVGITLKDIRLEKKLTLKQVSKAANVHVNTLRRIEEDKSDCRYGVVERIVAVLGYEIELMKVED